MLVGSEQRIFKTKTNIIDEQLRPFNTYIHNDIFYGEYSSIINVKDHIYSANLINFHDIDANYLTNNSEKEYILNLTDTNLPEFSSSAKNAELDIQKNQEESITYFPKYIQTPIDITYSENNAYFLLPLNTDKYVNLKQQDFMMNSKRFKYNATFKHNYSDLIEHQLSKTYDVPEDNAVPIYDLNFSFLETIKLSSSAEAQEFLQKYNLYNLIFNEKLLRETLLFNSTTNQLDVYNRR